MPSSAFPEIMTKRPTNSSWQKLTIPQSCTWSPQGSKEYIRFVSASPMNGPQKNTSTLPSKSFNSMLLWLSIGRKNKFQCLTTSPRKNSRHTRSADLYHYRGLVCVMEVIFKWFFGLGNILIRFFWLQLHQYGMHIWKILAMKIAMSFSIRWISLESRSKGFF